MSVTDAGDLIKGCALLPLYTYTTRLPYLLLDAR